MYENKAVIEEKNNYYDIPASSKLMTVRNLCNSLGSHFGIIMPTLVNLMRAKLYTFICPMQPDSFFCPENCKQNFWKVLFVYLSIGLTLVKLVIFFSLHH